MFCIFAPNTVTSYLSEVFRSLLFKCLVKSLGMTFTRKFLGKICVHFIHFVVKQWSTLEFLYCYSILFYPSCIIYSFLPWSLLTPSTAKKQHSLLGYSLREIYRKVKKRIELTDVIKRIVRPKRNDFNSKLGLFFIFGPLSLGKLSFCFCEVNEVKTLHIHNFLVENSKSSKSI